MVAFEYILLNEAQLCIEFRFGSNPVAIDTLGTLIVGFSCLYALITGQEFYMNIAIAWALLSFIGTIALAKYLEGRGFHE